MNQASPTYWEKVSNALAVRIRAPSIVQIGDETFLANAHFLDFGASQGTLVFHETADIQGRFKLLVDAGYGVTSFAAPDDSEILIASSWRETLADWTWTGNDVDRPTWLNEFDV